MVLRGATDSEVGPVPGAMMSENVLIMALVLGAPVPKEPPKIDADLVGEWKKESFTFAGQIDPPTARPSFYTFDADGKVFHRLGVTGGKPVEFAKYTLDRKASPTSIDIDWDPGLPGGGKWRGIMKIEGDTLTLRMTHQSEGPRPKAFESPKDSVNTLEVFKRTKKE